MGYFIPVFAVLIYSTVIFFLLRKHHTESRWFLLACFGFGICAAVISLFIEYGWSYYLGAFMSSHSSLVIVDSFIGVGLVEELSKWIWLVLIIRRWEHFDMYTDGILFTAGIAAGFSLVEGLLYWYTDIDITQSLIRSLSAVPVHFMLGIIMGFLFARYKIESPKFFWFSLFIPVLLHGLYDFFILQQFAELLMGAAIVVFAGSLSLSIWVCRTAYRVDRRTQFR